ncbi:LamG domain-containing protein, partial [bacterium]|nr:LamG domain-containing protein [bacterium]
MKNNLLLLTAISFSSLVATATAENPVAWWEFEKTENRIVYEGISQHPDTIEGNYSFTRGVSGDAIKLDGFTSVIRHPAEASADISGSFSVETWVALGAYPWEWCPVIIQMKENTAGFSFEIGPRGEFGLKIFISGNLISCISERSAIPLRQWVHIASVYEEEKGICIYLDGVLAGEYNIKGRPAFASKEDLRIGMNYHGIKPSNQIGDTGNRPYWFSIDGILDDIKIHDEAVEADYFSELYTRLNPKEEPDLQSRIMPFGPNSQGRFDACYTKLKYYDEWDALWPVSTDPDVVVTFDESPVRVVFWRGTRYSPAWVTDNNLWMCDQSVEAWNRAEGCFEHMQDRHCRYSHVRIIENTDARKVIHWRYAPVSAYDNLWREDEKTGWAVWIDEYYYIYPDATGIRKVTWKTGTLGHPRQFQESLPLTHPGQVQGDVIEPDYLVVANLEGKTQSFEYIEDAPRKTSKTIPESPNIQKHNLKSEYDPFIIFEPGNRMNYIRDRDIKSLSSPG